VCLYIFFSANTVKTTSYESFTRVDPPSHAQPPPRLASLALILRALNAPGCMVVAGNRLESIGWLRLVNLTVMMTFASRQGRLPGALSTLNASSPLQLMVARSVFVQPRRYSWMCTSDKLGSVQDSRRSLGISRTAVNAWSQICAISGINFRDSGKQ
jgi:hypothetical protein